MKKGIFITATGTDIGKTYVSALLVKMLRDLGMICDYFKPVLSGAITLDGKIVAGDVEYVLDKANLNVEPLERVSYIFKTPVSPHLASKMESVEIQLDKILQDFDNVSIGKDFVVVEGAGGVICPLNLDNNLFVFDVIKQLKLSSIIVADAGLGTINNAFLTVKFMRDIGLDIKGVILNNFDENNFMHHDNLATIEKICDIKVIGTVKKGGEEIEFITGALENLYE